MANLRRRIPQQTESLFIENHETFFNSIDPKQTLPRWQQFAVECVGSPGRCGLEATRFSGAVVRSEDRAQTTARRPDALPHLGKGPEVNSHEANAIDQI